MCVQVHDLGGFLSLGATLLLVALEGLFVPKTSLLSLLKPFTALLAVVCALLWSHPVDAKPSPGRKVAHKTAAKGKPAAASSKRVLRGGKVVKQGPRVMQGAFVKRGQARFKLVKRGGKWVKMPIVAAAVVQPERLSLGQTIGLHQTNDPLSLKSSVALVIDQDTQQVLFAKNTQAVLPIASLTKLMTALVVVEGRHSMDELITISQEDVDTEKGSRSRLMVGTQLSRGELLHLALMASENRAAHALGRSAPGGIATFVANMNARALALGMSGTRFVEPTGLSSDNRATAPDLAKLVQASYRHEVIRSLSISKEASVAVGARQVQFHNTNRLVGNPEWEIGLQKTGYISEAGRCLVMQAELAGRKLIMVLLDSAGKYSRLGDAERIRAWMVAAALPAAAVSTTGVLR
jgi:serine-type D-Ala-D-Ala endopeptidase (penicillin-binding protein 7)